ncbi:MULTISPECIES: hypothetical protein [unclassified Clostridium]|uniref:hypothetical protein n=1 Tax=unclassified Clostridium TaxID=2614128 RepID=UPI003F91B7A2
MFNLLSKDELQTTNGGKKLSKAQCAYLWGLCLSGAAELGSVKTENTCKLALEYC